MQRGVHRRQDPTERYPLIHDASPAQTGGVQVLKVYQIVLRQGAQDCLELITQPSVI